MVVIPTEIRRPADGMSRRFGIILSGLAANSNRMIPTVRDRLRSFRQSHSIRNDNELDCPADDFICVTYLLDLI
jgi:hypothetical protein